MEKEFHNHYVKNKIHTHAHTQQVEVKLRKIRDQRIKSKETKEQLKLVKQRMLPIPADILVDNP